MFKILLASTLILFGATTAISKTIPEPCKSVSEIKSLFENANTALEGSGGTLLNIELIVKDRIGEDKFNYLRSIINKQIPDDETKIEDTVKGMYIVSQKNTPDYVVSVVTADNPQHFCNYYVFEGEAANTIVALKNATVAYNQ